MINKNLEEIKEKLEKEINAFIMGGLSGGFQFDEEQAQELQELQDTMLYVFEEQENMIDQQSQAFEFMRHAAETRKDKIKELEKENEELQNHIETLNEIIGMYEQSEENE